MKLVKSLLLGTVAGVIVCAAGAQAADLPSRKAAPVEYVRICDALTLTGYFYIPGTDTCLNVGGRVRAEYRWTNQTNQYSRIGPALSYFNGGTILPQIAGAGPLGALVLTANPATPPGTTIPASVGNSALLAPQIALGSGTPSFYGRLYSVGYNNVGTKFLDQTGFRARGRIQLDARTNTAWGWLRTFVRFEITYDTGRYVNNGAAINNGGTFDTGTGVNVDKAFIQWAGITAGKAQSMFDFYADNYGYQDLRGSDASVNMLAYTATFGGGFSATLSLEDSASRRAGLLSGQGAANTNWFWAPVGAGFAYIPVNGGLNAIYGNTSFGGAAYNGTRWPDIVAALRVDQPWGAAQLSGAIHNQASSALLTYGPTSLGYGGPYNYGPVTTSGTGNGNSVGWAIQGGVQIKLPMLAAGDDLWIQAAYAHGALDYQQVGAQEFGRNPNGNGWRANGDGESVFYVDNLGYIHHTVPNSWTVLAAINHYWTPTFATSLRASYLQVNYGNGSRFPWSGTAYDNGGTVAAPSFNTAVLSRTVPGGVGLATNWSEWRVGINPEWYPVKGLTIGAELMYVHLNQKAPLVSGWNGATYAYGGSLVGSCTGTTFCGVKTWNNNANGWEARFRIQRDF